MTASAVWTWTIAAVTTGLLLLRPWRLPEAVWAVLGAACLVLFSLVPPRNALHAIGRGSDVYLFLAGMMLLAELARQEGVFDWLAAEAAFRAGGSARRLFGLVFAVGTVVTIFLSNDATAVVLTPAVYAIAKTVRAEPLPYLFVCAFIANAASFVLPISNPANLVVYGEHLPALRVWLAQFAVPSLVAIAATYLGLRVAQRRALRQAIAHDIPKPELSRTGRIASAGIAITALILVGGSALGVRLGLPTFAAGAVTSSAVLLLERRSAGPLLRNVSWSVLPLVAGLFVIVEGLACTGVIAWLTHVLRAAAAHSALRAGASAGLSIALACNLMNNLPAGLIAGSAIAANSLPAAVTGSLLIGVDLGPNFSVTGSLATLLWLVALRREGEHVSGLRFLKLGVVVTLPALLLTLGAFLAQAAR